MTRLQSSWIVTVWSILHQSSTWRLPSIIPELIAKYLWPPGVFYDSAKDNSVGFVCIHQFIYVIDRMMRKGGAE